jgi:signal transduction histidine kinase/ligand-binding sensor domain-containing protein/DNA-binding response OmpR family regulator
MRIIGLLLLVIFFSIQTFGNTKEYFFEQVSSDAGFSFQAVYCIVEDNDGFVWFGCNNGLYYNNTVETVKYNYDPLKNDSPPSNRIAALYKDNTGRIWVCTDNGICYFNKLSNSFIRLDLKESDNYLNQKNASSILQYSNDEFLIIINNQLYFFNINDQVLWKVKRGDDNEGISSLYKNADGKIYVGTTNGKVFINSSSISDFRLLYSSQSGLITTLNFINNNIWIGFDNKGIEVINHNGKLESRYNKLLSGDKHIVNNRVRKIIKRKNDEIWVGTYRGISIISPEGNRTIKQNQYNGLPHSSIYDLYIAKNDGVWVATWSGGIAYYNDYNYKFHHIKETKNSESVSKSVISSFAEDSDGNILIGSETLGLNKFNPIKKIFIDYNQNKDTWPALQVKSITKDKYNRHWFGTFEQGLWYLENNSLKQARKVNGVFASILAFDSGVWMGSRRAGLIYYDVNSGTFIRYKADDKKIGSISSNLIWGIFQDSKENLWIGSNFGLTVKRKGSKDFERFFYNENTNSLSRNLIYTISEDRNGKIWLGTNGGGIDIYDPKSNTFRKFRLNTPIENADVYSIIKDHQGNMWFSTDQGIYVYYTNTNTLKNFTEQDGLIGNQYNPNSGFISSSGLLFFGGANGFNIIDPLAVKQNEVAPTPFLSKLIINNQSIDTQKPRFVNSKFLAGIKKLELDYNQNTLTFGFASNNFIKPNKNRFRYRVNNYMDEWVETEHGNDVSFTKIPPGDYILEVMASNNDGLWNNTPKKIEIRIYPPIWLTWYAYLVYGFLVLTILIVVIRELRFRVKIREEIISEKFKHEADETLFSEKVKFFTNVSHEFRTPLTLIISPLNNLMNKFVNDPSMMDHIKIIKRNADRLLRLTNQILDFRLIELNKVRLKPEKEDIVTLCRNVYDCFEYQRTEKEINCIFTSSFKSLYLVVDPEKIEKVIYNLLSNAIKHAPEKGQIILSIEQIKLDENSYSKGYYTGNKFMGDSLEIKVKDNGKGIKPEVLPQIFDRFFVDHENEVMGTGIGLHICQEYISLHNGNIQVLSEKGNGAIFAINIPLESIVDFEKENMIVQYHYEQISGNEKNKQANEVLPKTDKVVLFAEDNDELRGYYKNMLSSKFKVLTAKNGQQAFEIASEVMPNIIISDVLMPGMDGLELTSKIRNTQKTNHIPIILLTALSDDKYKIESMNRGANTFLTKPIDESLLFAKIENIFSNREKLQKKYEIINSVQPLVSGLNETFTEKVERIVEKDLQNPSFEIAGLASELGMSRSSFHRKIKALVNLTPSEFIRDIRLKKAVELMKQGSYNVDEIGSYVGFNSSSYFIRSFKKKYGKTPKEFYNNL